MGGASANWQYDHPSNVSDRSAKCCLPAMDLMDESVPWTHFERDDTLSTLSNRHSHHTVLSLNRTLVLFTIMHRVCARTSENASITFNCKHVANDFLSYNIDLSLLYENFLTQSLGIFYNILQISIPINNVAHIFWK